MAYINIFGKNIFYEIYGENHKETLVYFHGGPGASCLDFEEQAKRLAKERKVILFDQYGVLRSEAIGIDENYSMKIRKNIFFQIVQILNRFFLKKVVISRGWKNQKSIRKVYSDF